MLALTNYHMKRQNLNEAHKFADMLIRFNENHEEGIRLLVTILNFKKSNDFTINYLEGILDKQPTSFKLIEIYLDVVRRVGK